MASLCNLMKALYLGVLRRRSMRSKGSRTNASLSKVAGTTDGVSNNSAQYHLLQDDSYKKGIGSVYRGQLKDGTQIAVKRLNVEIMKGVEDFCRQAAILGSIRHKNLLSLRGYCAEGQHRMLVYDFMHNSSLLSHPHGDLATEDCLDWQNRIAIAIGCAEGLAYLHHHSNPQLVHGGIKSSNVLLDSNYEPLWVDFGILKFLNDDVNKPKVATGYIAPEDMKSEEEVTKRSDVFSYGILLLELISGKNPAEKMLGSQDKLSIVEWAQSLIMDGKMETLVDPRLQGKFNREELERLLNAAIMCAQDRPENRLSMSEVVSFLKQEIP